MASDFHRILTGRAEFPAVLDALESHLSDCGVPATAIAPVMIAADEVVSNALDYGAAAGPAPEVRIGVTVRDRTISVEVLDNGAAFDPMAAAAPDTDLSVEDRAIGGLGIHLVRKLMDAVGYDRVDGRNRLRFSKTYI